MIGFIVRVALVCSYVLGTGYRGAPSWQRQDENLRIFQGTSRIVEKIEEAPFTVYIQLKDVIDKGKLKCTGSIITKDWVLSAGHCLPSSSETVRVYAGCSSRDDFKINAQTREVIEAKPHPKYKPTSSKLEDYTYDIGLMKVKRSFILGPKINTISLWARKWEGVQQGKGKYSSEECTAYGWGMEAPQNQSATNLRAGVFTVRLGEQACTCIPEPTERVSLCTAELSNKSICTGDDGGPIVCNGLLAGVESGGFTCPDYNGDETLDCGGKNVVSRWVYVCPVLGWIRRNVPEAPEPPPSCRSSPQIQISFWALTLSLYFATGCDGYEAPSSVNLYSTIIDY